MRRQVSYLVVAVVALTTLVSSGAGAAEYVLRTGAQGGAWVALGQALKGYLEAGLPDTTIQLIPGGGATNVAAVAGNTAQIAFGNVVTTVDALNGREPFDSPLRNICNIASLYPQYFQIVTPAASPVRTVADIAGIVLVVQSRGTTAELVTRSLLAAAGHNYQNMSRVLQVGYEDGARLVQNGQGQVLTLGTTVPVPAITQLAQAAPIRLVPVTDEIFARMKAEAPGLSLGTIPAGTYPGIDAPTPAVVWGAHLLGACNAPDALVYEAIKSIHTNLPALARLVEAMEGITLQQMAAETGIPMHAAAERYYREQGAL